MSHQIAFYGGSFNPPHYSHFLAAAWALCSGEVDEVWMIPCAAHAFGKDLAPFADRIAMCELGAAALSPKIRVSDVEAGLPPPNYTLHTLQHLQQTHLNHRFRLLVGADILHETAAWHAFDQVIEIAPLLVVGRAGIEGEKHSYTLPPFASSKLRQALAQGHLPTEAIPPSILQYIQEKRLYQKDQKNMTTPNNPKD